MVPSLVASHIMSYCWPLVKSNKSIVVVAPVTSLVFRTGVVVSLLKASHLYLLITLPPLSLDASQLMVKPVASPVFRVTATFNGFDGRKTMVSERLALPAEDPNALVALQTTCTAYLFVNALLGVSILA